MFNPNEKTALVAMSGGVDSSVAAYLMLAAGYDCLGVTMRLFRNEDIGRSSAHPCCSQEDIDDASEVAFALDIPHTVHDLTGPFRQQVMDRFVRCYRQGQTPNPCIDCNRYMKFEHLFRLADEQGKRFVVTGHYARIEYDSASERYVLKKALDESKDQSYVLYMLTQAQLSRIRFPLVGMRKPDVRAIAEAVHAASPETRMCIQQPGACFPEHRALYEACHAATGLPVGMRPGAGSYFDYDARDQIVKAYTLAMQMDTIGPLTFFDRWCPEIESCPRSFACRTGRGVLLEALEALAQGMNSISALVIDAGFETPEWYGGEILAPLARNAAMLKLYVAVNEGAVRSGYGVRGMPTRAMLTSSLPLKPLVVGVRSELARIVPGECAVAAVKEGPDAVRRLLGEDLLLDGAAAEALCRAGFGGEIGLAGCRRFPGGLRERFRDVPINKGFLAREAPVAGESFFLDLAKGTLAIGEYFSDAGDGSSPGVSAMMCETPSGRRRVVFGHSVFTSSMSVASGDRIVQMHRLADWASHGKSPVVADTPSRSFLQPRVRKDGSLASVVFVNTTIGDISPVRLRLRGVAAGVKEAVWAAFDSKDAVIPVVREGGEAVVTIPPVSAWNGGYLMLQER